MSENQEIPNGWAICKLGNTCIFSQGIQVDIKNQSIEKKENQARFLRIIDFTQGDDPPRYIDNPGERYYLKKDEIAMVRYGTVGFVCTGKEGAIANNLFKITPYEYLSKKYLINFLNSLLFKSKLDTKGATMQALSFGLINPIEIPIPPLSEQQRIVAKIEELFSSLDKGIENLKTAQQQLKVYRQSVLKWAFEGKLTNKNVKEGELPRSWQFKKIYELGRIETGTTPSKKNPNFYSDEYPFYKPTDLNAGNNVVSSTDGLSALGIKEARFVPAASTLVTCIGATIGKTGFIKKGGGFNQQINAIIPSKEINPKFIFYQSIGPDFQEQIQNNASATTLPILNKGKFENLIMVWCLPEEQQLIVAEIESRLSVCDKIEESIEQSLLESESLRQSILKKAFEGKLVPQDPNDEPASKLLERIKAEKEKTESKKSNKGRLS